MPDRLDILRVRTNTRKIVFRAKGGVDVSAWTGLRLVVDPSESPVDDSTKILEIAGTVVDGVNGRLGFKPDGTAPIGNYFYQAEGIDENGEEITFALGKYDIIETIPK